MSVPFSNTHLRVPRGFGTVLEGLAREVLRDQPGDIPEYASRYFQALLRQREESGTDPAEWAAKLEDRFYNNQAFKTTETDPEKETTEEVTSSQGFKKHKSRSTEDLQVSTKNRLRLLPPLRRERRSDRHKHSSCRKSPKREETHESQAEDESSTSTGAQNLSTALPGVGEKANLTESEDEENKDYVTEKNAFSVETGLSEGESINRLPTTDIQSDEPSSVEEQADATITALDHVDKAVNETDSSSVQEQNTPPPALESTDLLSFKGMPYVDVCAQELGAAEDEGGYKEALAVVDTESVNSDGEDNNGVGEPLEAFLHSRPADVDVCASELGETERAMERGSIEADTHVVKDIKSVKPQPEGSVGETSLSEKVEGSQQEVEDQLGKTGEEEKTETEPPSEETHESLSHVERDLDCNTFPKEDSLVEVNFEDIPEAQRIPEVVEKRPDEVSTTERIQTETLQIEQKEEATELIPSAIHQDISDAQKCEFESEGVRKEVDSEEEKVKSLQESTDLMEENVVTNGSNLNYGADDGGINPENVSSSDQPATESEKEKQEEETVQEIEDNEMVNEGKFHHYEDSIKGSEFQEDEKTDALEADEEEIYKEGHREMEDEEINDGGAGNNSSQVTHSGTSVVPVEPESEMFEESAQDLAEEEEESERTLGESQPGYTKEKKEATSKEAQEVNQKESDFEVQEKNDTLHAEESVSLWTAADHQDVEKLHESEEQQTRLAGESEDKEECSRPQEEEDIMDIPLDDPEANRAAAKIQAGFRGHMTRKKMKPEDKAEGEERQEDRGQ